MSKKLLREFYSLCPNGICESYLTEDDKRNSKENGVYYLTGLIQHADKKNGNSRIYPRKILEREFNNYQRIIEEKRSVGQLDHPEEAIVELSKVSHIVEKIWWEGDGMYGKLRVLKHHPQGQILEGLIKDGVQIGISSRGVGSVREESDSIIVEDDFQLICFDVVQEPSTTGAFLMREAKNIDKIFTKEDRIKRLINDIMS